MKVYKYCESKYNPLKGCPTLRLGTTSSFRKNYKGEGDFINDPKEGLADWKDKHKNTFTDIKGCPDGYLFCTVNQKLPFEIVHSEFDAKYDDCFCINDVEGFISQLFMLVIEQLNIKRVDTQPRYHSEEYEWLMRNKPFVLPENKDGIACFMRNGDINYFKENNVISWNRIGADELIIYTHFYKPQHFSKQSEYRIFFSPFHKQTGWHMELKSDDPMTIYSSTLLKFFEPCL